MEAIKKAQVKNIPFTKKVPDFVIQAFNECIAEAAAEESKSVVIEKVIERIEKIANVTFDKDKNSDWVDVSNIAPVYRKAGWIVAYYQSAYYEEYYKPYFTFS